MKVFVNRNKKGADVRKVKWRQFVGIIMIIAVKCPTATGGENLIFKADGLKLACDGQTDYVIVEGAESTPAEKYAVQELSQYMGKVTGALFKVISESDVPQPSSAFYVGWTKYASKQGIDGKTLNDEEWIIKSVGKNVILTGGRPRGTLYAVYEFLERQIGCHWLDEVTEVVPSRPILNLNALSICGQPAFWGRQIYTGAGDTTKSMALRARNKDTRATQTAEFGFGQEVGGHNFYLYSKAFPPDHPEYLAMNISGERPIATTGSGPGQICLTNPEVRKLVLAMLKNNIAKDRELTANSKDGRKPPRVYYLTPNDAPWNCQCPDCKAFTEREQADSGPLIDFVNSVADGIKDEYPEVLIGTFAYANNIIPPKTVCPRPNVIILMAQLNAEWATDNDIYKDTYPDLFRPLTSPINKTAYETLKRWSKIASRMEHWDYWVAYGKDKFPSPYVTLHCLVPDLKVWRDTKGEKIFTEYTGEETKSFYALTRWIGWKLMQNPDYEIAPLIKIFMDGYYGPAAGKMTEYLNYLENRIISVPEKEGEMCNIPPSQRPYLDLDFYLTSLRLLDEAETLCGANSAFLLHVKKERIPVDSSLYCMREKLKKQLPAGQSMPWKPGDIIERYKSNRLEQMKAHYPSEKWKESAEALEKEIVQLKGLAANRQGKLPPIVFIPKQPDDKAAGDPLAVDWKKGAIISKWATLVGTEQPERKIKGCFTHDGKYLYILLEEQGIDTSKLSKVWWAGDGWELFFSTKRGGQPYRQLAFNPEGKHYAFDYEKGQKAWASGISIKSDISGDCWRIAASLPLSSLMSENDVMAGRPLFINIFRTTPAPGTTMCLSPIYEANFHDMTRLAELRLEIDWPEAKDNLALGKSYTLNKKPNYKHCQNPVSDLKKLTDGNFAKKGEPIWFDKENTLGFCEQDVEITFDLEMTRSIERVFFHTAAGIAGVEPPKSIKVYASEDDKEYSLAGEELPEAAGQSGYKVFTIGIPVKKTNARYIRVAVHGNNYLLCDEIAITEKRGETR
jgi:hypothetical protein